MIATRFRTREMATMTGLKEETLLRALRKGEVSATRIGGVIYWTEAEVQAWLDSKRVDHGREPRLERRTG